ncbi:GNAT family N-acetyltransferase [Streptomyces sp. NPDC047024]|uniref:GNAT family N-acetyltransferase n=1 Tax=Streptomyces sp. NPDC047024 TaxID=3155476 RepID=UPI0034116F2B
MTPPATEGRRPAPWPAAPPLTTPRLHLDPLRAEHAREAFAFLDDVRLHVWTGGVPDTLAELEARYVRQAKGCSADGSQGWLNWMLRRRADGRLVGTVQATLRQAAGGGTEAVLAWVTGVAYQGEGYAREGARAMAEWLRASGVGALSAYIHPGHAASIAVARALHLSPSATAIEGEVRWTDHG